MSECFRVTGLVPQQQLPTQPELLLRMSPLMLHRSRNWKSCETALRIQ